MKSRVSLFTALIVLMGVIGCSKSERTGVTLLISGDTQGWITPCGCAANQSGGLARRGTLIENEAAHSNVLVLDVGGSAIGTGPYQKLKLASLLRGMQGMQLAMHNIGGPEAELGPEDLTELTKSTGVRWVSANLHDVNGEAKIEKIKLFEIGELKLAVTGVVDPEMVVHDRWDAKEATTAVLDAFEGVEADVKIVLAYFDELGLRRLAESLPEVDYVIGGPTGQSISPQQLGAVRVLSVTNKGKFVARVKLMPSDARFSESSASIIEVQSDLRESKKQIANLKDYRQRLAKKDFHASETFLVSSSVVNDDYAIAGSESCKACHRTDDQVWHNSKHSHAWKALLDKESEYDPFCQQCHTTGYGLTNGFESVALSTSLVHVGCENCHGPSAAHVKNPKIKTPFLAKEQCTRCHDHENSPQFDQQTYWAKIIHAGLDQTNE